MLDVDSLHTNLDNKDGLKRLYGKQFSVEKLHTPIPQQIVNKKVPPPIKLKFNFLIKAVKYLKLYRMSIYKLQLDFPGAFFQKTIHYSISTKQELEDMLVFSAIQDY